MANKKKSIWLSFDFGLKGNYNALFTFLDNHGAKDCGNNLAHLELDNPSDATPEKMIENLKSELGEIVLPSPNDRIYAIWRDDADGSTKVKGRFLFGKRKSPPWNGYGARNDNQSSDEAI